MGFEWEREISDGKWSLMSDGDGAVDTVCASAGSYRARLPQMLPYIAACFCVSTCSGGLILGLGPFSSRLVLDGYLPSEDVGMIFTGAFQIMTWGSLLAVHLENRLGPRFCACIGALIVFAGHAVLSALAKPSDPYVVMFAYGLLGWGGNHIFFTCFQFARLFPQHVGLADGLISGLFNFAGFVFLALNVSDLPFSRFFEGMACVTILAFLLILLLWPDKSYVEGDAAFMSAPTRKYVKRVFTIRTYRRNFHCILTPRYGLYVLTFAWSSLISTYVSGSLVAYRNTGCVSDAYLDWAFPLISNPTFLFSWTIGWLIDRTGFAGVSFALILCCQVSLLCLYATSNAVAAWVNLLMLNWICSVQYTVEFVFLHKAMPQDAFSVGLIVALFTQGVVGFVANPGLTPNPWGTDFGPPCFILGLPTILLFAWPLLEGRARVQRRRSESEGESGQLFDSPAAAGAPFHSVVLDGSESCTPFDAQTQTPWR